MNLIQLTGMNGEEVHVVVDHIQIVGEAYAHTPSSIDPTKQVATKVGTMVGMIGQQVVVKEALADVVAMLNGPTIN